MALLDRSSEEYRVVAGLIRSAQRRIGATESQRWNGDIAVLSPLSRQRSRSDLDGTIHLHPRNVIAPLMRADAGQGGRWWYPRAARDAAYNVIYEALRQSSKTAVNPPPAEPGKSLDSVLAPGARSLDMALAEQRTYEITQAVMSDNGMAQAYSDDPPEAAAVSGRGHALPADPLVHDDNRRGQRLRRRCSGRHRSRPRAGVRPPAHGGQRITMEPGVQAGG